MNYRRLSKYICAVGLAAAMSVTTMAATTIADVTTSHWAYESIVDLQERGIMVLTSGGQFYPNQTMNYFEVADVLAKATGYVDSDIVTNIDKNFKEQIQTNYEKQKATLDAYASKYSTWNKAYNQQIAYLLGRGYMSTSDLDLFITKTSNGETKNIVTKEQLAVYIVRMLGKEVTAKSTYQKTSFTDDSSLNTSCKPYVEYLRTQGLIKPDTAGKANGKMQVTKALCAKLVSDALSIHDTTQIGKVEESKPTAPSENTSTAQTQNYTIGKVLTKNTSEYYILLQDKDGKSSYYSFKATSPIKDATGAPLAITKLVVGTNVSATIELQGGIEYITSIKVVDSSANSGTTTTKPGQDQVTAETTTVSGMLLTNISNEIVRVSLSNGSSQVYLMNSNCTITLNGVSLSSTDRLKAGDTVTITLVDDKVTKIQAISSTTSTTPSTSSNLSSGEIKAKKFVGNNYVFTIVQNNVEGQVNVPVYATATRNGKTTDLANIRIGDTVKFTKENEVITTVEATGEKSTIETTVRGIYIASNPQLIVDIKGQQVTYAIASDAEVYDNNIRDYINIRDLHLGQEITLVIEGKEIISIDVEKPNNNNNELIGTIVNVGKDKSYIEVLLDYDYITGESKVYKRIETPSNLVVMVNGNKKDHKVLNENMDIVISYKYLDDSVPEKISII